MRQSLSSILPLYFRSNPLFERLSKDIDNSKVMSSFLLYSNKGRDFILNKDGIMHAPLDWQLFSLMRATSKLSISSGNFDRI